MRISKQIGHTHMEEMELIRNFVEGFDVDRLLYAINGRHFDEDDIRSMTLDIKSQCVKLERQKQYLFSFGKTFNKEWATDDNECFDTSLKVSRKIRSGTKGVRSIVKRFCRTTRRKAGSHPVEQQAINVSLISTPHYIVDMYGMPSYPACVKELFTEMLTFYGHLYECIEEAIRVLNEEKDLRKDSRRCLELFVESCEKSKKQQQHLIEAIMSDEGLKQKVLNNRMLSSDKDNPALKEWRTSDEESFASQHLHHYTPMEVGKIALQKALQETDDPDLVACKALFDCEKEKAKQINEAIDRFDELLPKECKRGKIPAVHLVAFKNWCSQSVGNNTFLTYFNKRYKGKWGKIGRQAMSNAMQNKQYDSIKNEMLDKLAEMFP